MKLEVDWTRCDGHGICARLLPEQITLDEWGFPLIAEARDDLDPTLVRHARRTVAACPQLALRITRAGDAT